MRLQAASAPSEGRAPVATVATDAVLASLWAIVVLAFAVRDVPRSSDDAAYILNFTDLELDWSSITDTLSAALFWIEEPLWTAYCVIATQWLGLTPEDAIRLTVLLSLLLVTVAALRTVRPALFLGLYALVPYLLITVNYTQLRQGFALAVFLWLWTAGRRAPIAALIASGFHTSFLLVLFAGLLARFRIATGVLGVAAALLVLQQLELADFLGRRAQYAEEVETLNVTFWLAQAGFLTLTFALVVNWGDPLRGLARLTLLYMVFALGVVAIGLPLSGRLLYIATALQLLCLSMAPEKTAAWWAFVAVSALFFSYTHVATLDASDFHQTYRLARWF